MRSQAARDVWLAYGDRLTAAKPGNAVVLAFPAPGSPTFRVGNKNLLWQILHRANAARRGLVNACWLAEARLRGCELGQRIILNGRPCINRYPGSRIALADGVCLNSSLRSNPLGCSQPVVLRTLRANAEIILGRGVGLSSNTVSAALRIQIGEGTLVGAGVVIIDNDFHSPLGEWNWRDAAPENPKPVVIGRGVFIGTRAIILKGVTIGDRATVGAGAVVSKDVPVQTIAVGNPARVIAGP